VFHWSIAEYLRRSRGKAGWSFHGKKVVGMASAANQILALVVLDAEANRLACRLSFCGVFFFSEGSARAAISRLLSRRGPGTSHVTSACLATQVLFFGEESVSDGE